MPLKTEHPMILSSLMSRKQPSKTSSIWFVQQWSWIHQKLTSFTHLTATQLTMESVALCLKRILMGNVNRLSYRTRFLLPADENYSTSERDCMAVVKELKTLRLYLMYEKFTGFYRPLCIELTLNDKQFNRPNYQSETSLRRIWLWSWIKERPCKYASRRAFKVKLTDRKRFFLTIMTTFHYSIWKSSLLSSSTTKNYDNDFIEVQ